MSSNLKDYLGYRHVAVHSIGIALVTDFVLGGPPSSEEVSSLHTVQNEILKDWYGKRDKQVSKP